MNGSKFKSNEKLFVKTKLTYSFLFCFLIIIFYLLIWILIGEFNLLSLNWFNQSNYSFDLKILYWSFGIVLFSILFFIILYFLKVVKIDLIPFLLMSNTIGMVTIFSAGIPIPAGENSSIYIVMARFFIVIFSGLIIFFISNAVVIRIMLNSPYSHYIYEQYKKEAQETASIKKEIDERKKSKKQKDYVEIIEEN
ncbi:MAG: hypothetical protein K2I67_01870 [Malacoplasma sp.]|nr:hypothetical protein [Malacoplasma sp.]